MYKVSYKKLNDKYEDMKKQRDDLIKEKESLRKSLKVNIKYIKKIERELLEYKILLNEQMKRNI